MIKALIGANRRPPRRFKSLLNGVWLRHPLHPLITDIPIGSWVLAALFDIIWLVAPKTWGWAAQAAAVVVAVGAIAGLAAILTGMTDWSDTYGAERRTGLWHGALNTAALALYIVSLVFRFQAPGWQSLTGAILGFVGLATVTVGGYLGGSMVFAKGTGVNHTAWEAASDDYEAVMAVERMPENHLERVTVAGAPVILLRLGDQYRAISATCSHAGGPLDEGTLDGDVVTCPWHGSRFSMRTGNALTGPATMAQPRYDVRVRDGQIELKRRDAH
jgi:nitrite reductase/ring-hydroxylating ferredoxin subunit/uncharacterized membrane protein